MLRIVASAYRIALAAVVGVGVSTLIVSESSAAPRRASIRSVYAPPYAAMVVDAKTGKVLHAENPDALRRPASITKVMTLYLLFEQMERGRMTLETPLKVSSYAERQAPSKLGLGPGDTITVEDAIKALVTKSANDVAVVVAESIAGSEAAFAIMMTRKAQSLGMSRTTFRNASGLPNPEQLTTARDLITLGRAIQDRFPRQYGYFSIRVFNYEGDAHGNHNKLLGRVEGVDGIKTGFTAASGFNLLTSAKLDGRHVVAAVLGGRSGPSRDAIMADLIEENLPKASAGPRTSPIVAEAARDDAPVTTAALTTKSQASDAPPPISKTTAEPRNQSATLKTKSGKPVLEQGDEAMPPLAASSAASAIVAAAAPKETPSEILRTPSGPMVWKPGATPAPAAQVKTASLTPVALPAKATPAKTVLEKPATKAEQKAAAKAAKLAASKPAPSTAWFVQVGATPTQAEAKAILGKARTKLAGMKATPSTEKITAKRQTLYRAKLSGFTEASAEQACKRLKKSGMSCFAAKG